MKIFFSILLLGQLALAHIPVDNYDYKPVIADLRLLKVLGFPVLSKDEEMKVGYTIITPSMEQKMSQASHFVGKCANFMALDDTEISLDAINKEFENLRTLHSSNQKYLSLSFRSLNLVENPAITEAIKEVSAENLKQTVTWLSSYPDRYNKSATPNRHVVELKARLEQMLQGQNLKYEISTVAHRSTKQETLKLVIPGADRPNEIVVLGGHLDSINAGFMGIGGGGKAPGADDNASGSANLIEALRIIANKGQPQRTIEFYWYAGEESGLLGSNEIAVEYKRLGKDVVAVLQLDMTLFPGSGALTIGNVQDFTSAWLRDYLVDINNLYLKVKMVADECGYACSDHASWHKQGYPALMPFEATTKTMNPNIHTVRDLINPQSNFEHSAVFSKIAVIFAMDLANSNQRQPY